MRRRGRSIRVRLAATITLALALVLSFGAAATYVAVGRILYRNVDANLERQTAAAMGLLEREPDPPRVARQFYDRIVEPVQVTYLQVLDRGGNVLYLSPQLTEYHLPVSVAPEIGTLIDGPHIFRYYAVGAPWYTITVAVPVNDIVESLRVLRLTVLITLPVALLLTLGLGYTVARRGLHPVDEITATAQQITSQNLRQRIPPAPADDELGRLVTTLNAMIARLEESFTAITQFTTNAAHELRTPLTILRGENEVALRAAGWSAEQRALLQSHVEEVNRLTAIVDDLFLLARTDSHALTLTWALVSLPELLREQFPRFTALAAPKSITVRLETPAACRIVGDRARLSQAVLNLVDNAIKYSPSGSTVTLAAGCENHDAVLRITDEGMGIDPRHHTRIFERFYRTDEARTRAEGGTGLGLAIARGIVEAHRGTLTVESAPSRGSTFVIHLPRAEVE